jgi:hypothetical protein
MDKSTYFPRFLTSKSALEFLYKDKVYVDMHYTLQFTSERIDN